MAEYTIVQVKRDSTLNWYASNPRLALGEPGVDMDLHRFKIGNGIDRWNELPYMDDDLYKLLDKQQQATADYVQDLLNKIAANKLDADQKYNALTNEIRNTSRDLTGRMTAVETGQTEYQKNLTERQQEFEEAVTGDFEDTKSEVQAGLDEFNETRDSLTVRMNAIAGQATEDTEILDARVDAESRTHPNLGENIRNIHSEVLSVKQSGAEEKEERIAADEAERTARITADEAERAERTAAYETERTERITADEQHEAEIAKLSDKTEKLSEHGEFLQEQVNDTAEAELAVQEQLFREIQRHRDTERELEQEITARENADDALNEAVRAEAQRISDIESITSRKDTELAGRLDTEKQSREQADDELKDWNVHSDARTSELGEYLQEQINETAEETLRNSIGLYEETKARQTADSRLEAKTDSLQEQINEANKNIQGNADDITLEREKREQVNIDLLNDAANANSRHNSREKFLQEQADENAYGLFTMQVLLAREIERARKETARLEDELLAVDDRHSEREEQLAGNIQENTANTREKISAHAEYLQEQADELADLVVSEMLQNRENLRVVQEDIQLEAQTRSKIDAQIRESIAEIDEAHSLNEAKLQGNIEDGISAARRKTLEAAEHLQEQADILAAELQQANISSWRKTRELNAEDKRLHEEITDAEQRLHAETEETASAIRQEMQDDVSGLGRNLTRRDEHLQEQADELAGAVFVEAIERRKDTQELKQKISGTAKEIEVLVSNEAAHRENGDAELSADIEAATRHDEQRDEYLQEQTDQNAQANFQHSLNIQQETEYRRRDIQSVREEISSEKLERARDIDSVRTEHSADISRLEDADSVAAKIRHDEDSGLMRTAGFRDK